MKDTYIRIRVTTKEKTRLKMLAELNKTTMSDILRRYLNRLR